MRASRTRDVDACTDWHVDGVIETLVEILDSDWVAELRRDTADIQRDGEKWQMHHYMIFMDNHGCIEAIAESWELLPERIEPSRG